MLRNRSGARGDEVASGYSVGLDTVPVPSIMAVQEWASTTSGYSSSASTHAPSRSRAYRSSSAAHLNSSPLACSTVKLWFGARPMLRGCRKYRIRESCLAYCWQISAVLSVEALSEMISSKSS